MVGFFLIKEKYNFYFYLFHIYAVKLLYKTTPTCQGSFLLYVLVWSWVHFWSVSDLFYDLGQLNTVITMLLVTLEKPTVLLYITITFFHNPPRPDSVME